VPVGPRGADLRVAHCGDRVMVGCAKLAVRPSVFTPSSTEICLYFHGGGPSGCALLDTGFSQFSFFLEIYQSIS